MPSTILDLSTTTPCSGEMLSGSACLAHAASVLDRRALTQRFVRRVAALAALITVCATGTVSAQVSPAGGGADTPPTQAQASSPSPETGKRLEPQLFGFILIGGGLISLIGVILTDRRVRADYAAKR